MDELFHNPAGLAWWLTAVATGVVAAYAKPALDRVWFRLVRRRWSREPDREPFEELVSRFRENDLERVLGALSELRERHAFLSHFLMTAICLILVVFGILHGLPTAAIQVLLGLAAISLVFASTGLIAAVRLFAALEEARCAPEEEATPVGLAKVPPSDDEPNETDDDVR